jgi:hypothetical protein
VGSDIGGTPAHGIVQRTAPGAGYNAASTEKE